MIVFVLHDAGVETAHKAADRIAVGIDARVAQPGTAGDGGTTGTFLDLPALADALSDPGAATNRPSIHGHCCAAYDCGGSRWWRGRPSSDRIRIRCNADANLG